MKNLLRCLLIRLLVLALSLGMAPTGLSQTVTAVVTGAVTDQSGAVVPNVKVAATNQGTKIEYSAPSNDAGVYTIPFVPIGTYVVAVEASGFKKLVTNPIKLEINQIARVDLKLELGEVTQQIEVEGVVPVLQTESVTVGQVISGTTTASLPLNGRNFQQLTLLVPGSRTATTQAITDFWGSSATVASSPVRRLQTFCWINSLKKGAEASQEPGDTASIALAFFSRMTGR